MRVVSSLAGPIWLCAATDFKSKRDWEICFTSASIHIELISLRCMNKCVRLNYFFFCESLGKSGHFSARVSFEYAGTRIGKGFFKNSWLFFAVFPGSTRRKPAKWLKSPSITLCLVFVLNKEIISPRHLCVMPFVSPHSLREEFFQSLKNGNISAV